MSKQVEVPEGVAKKLARHEWERQRCLDPHLPCWDDLLHGHRSALCRGARTSFQAVLPSIYKHFCDRLLSPEIQEIAARKAAAADMFNGSDYRKTVRESFEAAVEALQATSTPEDQISDVLLDQANALAMDPEVDDG